MNNGFHEVSCLVKGNCSYLGSIGDVRAESGTWERVNRDYKMELEEIMKQDITFLIISHLYRLNILNFNGHVLTLVALSVITI